MKCFTHQITHNSQVSVGYKSDLETWRSKITQRSRSILNWSRSPKRSSGDLEDQDQRSWSCPSLLRSQQRRQKRAWSLDLRKLEKSEQLHNFALWGVLSCTDSQICTISLLAACTATIHVSSLRKGRSFEKVLSSSLIITNPQINVRVQPWTVIA